MGLVAINPKPDRSKNPMSDPSKRVLAIDPGDVRIGLAISDESGTIANPLMVVKHVARGIDSKTIAALAEKQGVSQIIIGCSLDDENQLTPQARKAQRLADALVKETSIPVKLWDEFESTKEARRSRLDMGVSQRKRAGHLDEIAATIILQSYLDAKHGSSAHQGDK
jgi:putative Holliday junction resolvase